MRKIDIPYGTFYSILGGASLTGWYPRRVVLSTRILLSTWKDRQSTLTGTQRCQGRSPTKSRDYNDNATFDAARCIAASSSSSSSSFFSSLCSSPLFSCILLYLFFSLTERGNQLHSLFFGPAQRDTLASLFSASLASFPSPLVFSSTPSHYFYHTHLSSVLIGLVPIFTETFSEKLIHQCDNLISNIWRTTPTEILFFYSFPDNDPNRFLWN